MPTKGHLEEMVEFRSAAFLSTAFRLKANSDTMAAAFQHFSDIPPIAK